MTQPQPLAPLTSRTALSPISKPSKAKSSSSRFTSGLRIVFAALVAVSFSMPFARAAMAQHAPDGFADLAEKLLPAVVNISTTQTPHERAPGPGGGPGGPSQRGPEIPQFPPGSPFEEFFKDFFDRNRPDSQQQQARKIMSLGSGFIVDASGYVVTNNHVIEDADEITVILHDDTNLKAKLVGRDKNTDLALLKVESSKPLPFVKFGDSDKARVGDWVVAIGNPFGLGGTVTAGIISARARDIQSGPYDDFIQTDASINRGNSGGPMFNINGDVIGINTAIFSPSGGSVGIGFAIPSSLAKPVIDQLRATGKTRRGWLGVRIQQVTDEIAESLGLDKARGALVAGVTDGGPAEKGGLESGDVVLKFDGKDVTEMRRLPRIVAETPVDKEVPVTVWRKGHEENVRVKVGELKDDEVADNKSQGGSQDNGAPKGSVSVLGMGLADVNGKMREQFKLPTDAKGVVVVDVQGNSPAGEKGIRAGDLVLEVAQDKVDNAADVKSRIDKAKTAKRKSILLLVERQGDQRFVVLPLS